MKIIIYGAGAIGSVIGGYLWQTGHKVVLIGRASHVNIINEKGLKLITPTGTNILRIPSVTSPAQIDFNSEDVVFMCMKSQDTEESLRILQRVRQDVPLFCLQNGVRNEETAMRYFPKVYGAVVRIGAEYLNHGEVICRRDPPGWIMIGKYPRGTDHLAEKLVAALQEGGFFAKVVPDIMPYKWGKLMLNLSNAIDAITDTSRDKIEPIAQLVMQELIDLLEQIDIKWITQDEAVSEWPETKRQSSVLKTKSYSSTWQSLARQQGSLETEFLNGEVVRLAKQLGKQAPINEKLLQITQEMCANREKPGKYTLSQLCSILGLTHILPQINRT